MIGKDDDRKLIGRVVLKGVPQETIISSQYGAAASGMPRCAGKGLLMLRTVPLTQRAAPSKLSLAGTRRRLLVKLLGA